MEEVYATKGPALITVAKHETASFSIRTEVHARKSANRWDHQHPSLHNLGAALSWTTIYCHTEQSSQVEYAWECLHHDLESIAELES